MSNTIIWTNQYFDAHHTEILTQRIAPAKLIVSTQTSASNLVAGERDPTALQADVLFGQPHVDDLLESTALKFVQLSTAGYTRYDTPALFENLKSRGIVLANASSLYDEPCAQHALAMLLSLARAIPQAAMQKQNASWQYLPLRGQSFLLDKQNVLLVGYGSIARRLVELLSPFRLNIKAIRRTPRGDENCATFPIDTLDQHLPGTDIVINTLPASQSTKGIFDLSRLSQLPPHAIYLNIGRGDTTDQPALASLLKTGRLRYAFLDVTTPEPLPPDNELWQLPNCFITPHTAGGTFDEPVRMIDHMAHNVHAFLRGDAMTDRII